MNQPIHTEEDGQQNLAAAFPPLDKLDATIPPEIQIDTSVGFMQVAHDQKQEVQFDFDEHEFTRAYPDWKNR